MSYMHIKSLPKICELTFFFNNRCALTGRKLIAGSCNGSMKETQEMIAGKNNITADIEVIPIDYLNTAMERLAKADVRYRFVIDIGNTLRSS